MFERRILPQVGSIFAGHTLERELGRGGMGIVFLARGNMGPVAIKVLTGSDHPQSEQRFLREAQALAEVGALRHIVGIHTSGIADGFRYIVTEFIEGEDLSHKLETPWPVEDALRFIIKIAGAVSKLHARAVIHRDLKPSNILIRQYDSEPIIADFGIARLDSADTLTKTGEFLGTPHYMSPEQMEGKAIGPATDIWSLGCILHHMLAASPPFNSENALELMARVAASEPEEISLDSKSTSQSVKRILSKALAKESSKRYSSADLMAADCQRVLDGNVLSSPNQFKKMLVIGLITCSIGLAVLITLNIRQRLERSRLDLAVQQSKKELQSQVQLIESNLEDHLITHLLDSDLTNNNHPDCNENQRLIRAIKTTEIAAKEAAIGSQVDSAVVGDIRHARALTAIEDAKLARSLVKRRKEKSGPMAIGVGLFRDGDFAAAKAVFSRQRNSDLAGFAIAVCNKRLGQREAAWQDLLILERKHQSPGLKKAAQRLKEQLVLEWVIAVNTTTRSSARTVIELAKQLGRAKEQARLWETLQNGLNRQLSKLETRKAILLFRNCELAQGSEHRFPVPKPNGSLRLALAKDAEKRRDMASLRHYLVLRRDFPKIEIPPQYHIDLNGVILQKKVGDLLTLFRLQKSEITLDAVIELTRMSVRTFSLSNEEIIPAAQRGHLDRLVAQRPADPVLRFWRARLQKVGAKQRVEDLSHALAHGLPKAFKGEALRWRGTRYEADYKELGLSRKVSLEWALRDLKEALELPASNPDLIAISFINMVLHHKLEKREKVSLLRAAKNFRDFSRLRIQGTDAELAKGHPWGAGLVKYRIRLGLKISEADYLDALIQHRFGNCDKTESLLTKFLDKDVRDERIPNFLANCALKRRRYKLARRALNSSKQRNKLWHNLSSQLKKRGY
ncbi:MAG: serine/threonine-protein kinase [Planctomycetota bacterium]|nr:serine/threonine-protein kinase [Planctomycetota bacterium]